MQGNAKITPVPAVVVALGAAAPAMAEMKVGVVNYGRLMQESPQAKAAQQTLEGEFLPRQRDVGLKHRRQAEADGADDP